MKTAAALEMADMLPRASTAPETAPAASDLRAARRPCVLLAEDDREMRMLIATTLRRSGWDVVEASDGVDLLDLIGWVLERRDDWADCVLVSDVRMPNMNGFEVLEHLSELGWPGGIVLITAFGDEATHARGRELGAHAVLDKPFDFDVLCDAIRQVHGS
jgi:DNA-binding response OmpR family regulator